MNLYQKINILFGTSYNSDLEINIAEIEEKDKLLLYDFFNENSELIPWITIPVVQTLSEDFIEEFSEVLDWENISRFQKISSEIIEKYSDRINWFYLGTNINIPEWYIKQNFYKFRDDIYRILAYRDFSEDFLERFCDEFDNYSWNNISKYQMLSEIFIKKYQDYLNWELISQHQNLSEEFIEEFEDKVFWCHIGNYQRNLSEEFKEKYKNRIQTITISSNESDYLF